MQVRIHERQGCLTALRIIGMSRQEVDQAPSLFTLSWGAIAHDHLESLDLRHVITLPRTARERAVTPP